MNHKEITQSPDIKAKKALYQPHKFSEDSPHKWNNKTVYHGNEAEESSNDCMQGLRKITPHESRVSFDKPNKTLCGKGSYVVCVGKKYPELITIDSPTNANDRQNEEIKRLQLDHEKLIERFEMMKKKYCF